MYMRFDDEKQRAAASPDGLAAYPGGALLEVVLLAAVPLAMGLALVAGFAQTALLMLLVVTVVLALFFAGYEAGRPALRQIMPRLCSPPLRPPGVSCSPRCRTSSRSRPSRSSPEPPWAAETASWLGPSPRSPVTSSLVRACGVRGRCTPGAWSDTWAECSQAPAYSTTAPRVSRVW